MDNTEKASSPNGQVGTGEQPSEVAGQQELIQKQTINQEFERQVNVVLQKLVDEKFTKEVEDKVKEITKPKKQRQVESQVLTIAKKRLEELSQQDNFKKEFEMKSNIEIQKRIQQMNQQSLFDKELEKRKQEQQNYYNQQQAALFGVVNRTREFSIINKPPKDTNRLYRVEYPETGGLLSYMENFILPYRGFPYQEAVMDLDKCKKIGKTFLLVMLEEISQMNKLKVLFILLFLPSLARSWLKSFHVILRDQRFKEEMYCQPVRELWRAINTFSNKAKTATELRFTEIIRDLACIFLEYDNAYKYRWQDLMPEFNKKLLMANPLKEINRVIDIAISREMPADMETGPKIHWRKLKYIVNVLFRVRKSYLYITRDLIMELNFDEVKMIPEDICYCESRTDYSFGYHDKKEYKDWLKIKRDYASQNKKINEKVYTRRT